MKLKSVAAATLAVMAAGAHAQSSVTLFGALDAGLMYQNTSAATLSPTAANTGSVFRYKDGGIYSSFWGLLGTEDLGGGYRVNFKLQSAFNTGTGALGLPDTAGTVALFNQIARVGVSGPFGSFDVGRQIAPIAIAMVETDARGAQYFGSILTAWAGMNFQAGWSGASTNVPIGALFDSNALVYRTPRLLGAQLALEYAPGGVPGSLTAGSRESAVLSYQNGSLDLAAAWYDAHDTNPSPVAPAAPTGINNNRQLYFGAKYTISNFFVSGSYSNGKNPAHSNLVNYDLWSLGAGYQFTPAFNVTSGVYYLRDKNNSSNKAITWAVTADYSVSKRTVLYADVGGVNNMGTMRVPVTYGQLVAPGQGTVAVLLGIRHTF
ncbi:porin [Paraburkholderia sp. A1RI-2L]|uniref:porin n=1 Tax=Paraburkholderia TaxID=1822464 RepID=UPI00054336CC|nr:porin [Paraburkholderia sacchari]NLP62598.1 porin [Paraburkholderia sacchari]